MTKFKSGDKAEFIERYGGYKIGDVVEIIDVVLGGAIVNAKGKQGIFPIHSDSLKLVEPKPSKNQRITALEKEVAELKAIVHELRKPSMVTEDVAAPVVEDKPKTPNQQRKEIIEKAKGFMESTKESWSGVVLTGSLKGEHHTFENVYPVFLEQITPFKSRVAACKADFIVNEEKRTVVALMRSIDVEQKGVYVRGIAKCHPSDVFNEHIGKAIALGRALRLNVREFEQAVQPTVAVGQLFVVKGNRPFKRRVGEITSMDPHFDDFGYGTAFRHTIDNGWLGEEQIKILNDTNAIY